MKKLILLAISIFFALPLNVGPAGAVVTQWEWQSPVPQGNTLQHVWGAADNYVFAVGHRGTILFYNGTNWTKMDSGTTAILNDIWGFSSREVYAVGSGGVILKYDGTSWTIFGNVGVDLYGIWGPSGSELYVVGDQGSCYRYTPAGGWQKVALPSNPTSILYSVWGSSSTDVFIVGANGLSFHKDGAGWTQIATGTTSNLYSVYGVGGPLPPAVSDKGTDQATPYPVVGASMPAMTVGENGTIFRYNYTTNTWTRVVTSITGRLNGVWGTDSGNVHFTGSGGAIYYYNGTTAVQKPSGTNMDLFGIRGTSSSKLFTVGKGGVIVQTLNSVWTKVTTGTENDLWGVWGVDNSSVQAVGQNGTILLNNVSTWSSVASGTTQWLKSMQGPSLTNRWIVGTGGTILKWNAGGWVPETSPTTQNLYGVWVTDVPNRGQQGFIVGNAGTILQLTTAGWVATTSPTVNDLKHIWGYSGTDANGNFNYKAWAVGFGGTILRYDYATSTWVPQSIPEAAWTVQPSPTTNNLWGVWALDFNEVFAVGENGTILRTTDGGATWMTMNSGVTHHLYGVWGTGGHNVLAVGGDGSILRYNGTSWASLDSGTSNILRGVFGIHDLSSPTMDFWTVGDSGTILHSQPLLRKLTVATSGNGTVTSRPPGVNCGANCIVHYYPNTTIQLIPTPATGWQFTSWQGDCSGSTVPCNLTLDVDKSTTAVFASTGANLQVTKVGNGTVTSTPAGIDCGPTCSAQFATGTVVTLRANPDAGWAFGGWNGPCSGTGDCQVTIGTAATSVGATFNQVPDTLTVNKTGNGTVTSNPAGINCGPTCSSQFANGTVVSLTAVPDSGWFFAGWTGPCSGTGPCQVTINGAIQVGAAFRPSSYSLTINKTGNGRVTSNPAGIDCGQTCSSAFAPGTVVSLTAAPDAGWSFAGWNGPCTGTGPCQITIRDAVSVGADFTAPPNKTLTVTVNGPGKVVSSPTGIDCGSKCQASFPYGTVVNLDAVANVSGKFAGWSGPCSGTTTPCPVTMTTDQSAEAKFDTLPTQTYTLIWPAGSKTEDYTITSIPLEPKDPSLTAVFGPYIGQYDPTLMRIGRWSPLTNAYIEYPGNNGVIHPADAGWFLFLNGMKVIVEGYPAPVGSMDGQLYCKIPIESGWNQVGNPFTYTVDVNAIKAFDANTNVYEPFVGAAPQITQGIFWVYVKGEYYSTTTLPVTTGGWVKKTKPGSGALLFKAQTQTSPSPHDQTIVIDPKSGFGLSTQAVPDDVERPPAPPAGVSSSGSSTTGGGGGGGGGGGCFISTLISE